ncbi:accessory Sec system S-layer assembly protein [Bacillus lacus]|uniref:Accessory Sec system S-layer assembly protein n=1 Tax=Metabacillus lacus TaxID=1983721 RepID=A0A7X2IYT1_9BACI|nr:accessory Sec system S-layer assembly protein [Metabacillus lacus]MRX72161.1 accessory Sec system S-layer assembly protein [Metabacillus lacus]
MTEHAAVNTTLSLHPQWELSKQEEYVYQFHHQQLLPMKENQINITGIKLESFEDFFSVTAFVRSTVSEPLKFEMLQLLLLDAEENIVARESFDMYQFGDLPANSSRPWKFFFPASSIEEGKKVPEEGWVLAFELKKKQEHKLDLGENAFSEEQSRNLQALMEKMPPVKQNEVNFIGLNAGLAPSKELHVTLLIRNGSLNDVQLEQLPLMVTDAANDVVAQGVFQLKDFTVKANTSKPWSFVFPTALLRKEEPDLSSWRVTPLQEGQ